MGATLLTWMALTRARKLHAVMFKLTLAMEIHGTAPGNWAWHGEVPWPGKRMRDTPQKRMPTPA